MSKQVTPPPLPLLCFLLSEPDLFTNKVVLASVTEALGSDTDYTYLVPDEVLLHLLSYLMDPVALCQVACVCKRYSYLTRIHSRGV